MKECVFTRLAASDLDEIWDHLASESIDAADRVLSAIEKALRCIAQNPEIGHWRQELADRRHKFLLVYSYLIVYRPQTKPIQVVRILHASRDAQRLLRMPPS